MGLELQGNRVGDERMTDLTMRLGGFQSVFQVFEVMEPAKAPKQKETFGKASNLNSELDKPFPAPGSYFLLIGALNAVTDMVRDNWGDIPEKTKKRLRVWVSEVSSDRDEKSRNIWTSFVRNASIKWASIKLDMDVQEELDNAFQGLVNAILEEIATEPPRKVRDFDELFGVSEAEAQAEPLKIYRQ